jgi:hypothetical protein
LALAKLAESVVSITTNTVIDRIHNLRLSLAN